MRRKILDNVLLLLVLELLVKRIIFFFLLLESWFIDVDFIDISENLVKKLKFFGIEEVCCFRLVFYLLSFVVVYFGIFFESGYYYFYVRNIIGLEFLY